MLTPEELNKLSNREVIELVGKSGYRKEYVDHLITRFILVMKKYDELSGEY